METKQLYIYTPPKYVEQWNQTYILPVIKHPYAIDRSEGSINAMATELMNINRTTNKLAGTTAYYSAKVRKAKARKEYTQLTKSLTYLSGYTDLTFSVLNILIKPKQNSKKIALLQECNAIPYLNFINKDGENALKALSDVRKSVNKLLAKYYRNKPLKLLNHDFKAYSIEQDIEYNLAVHTTAKGIKKPQLHEHMHGLLILPTKDIKQVTKAIKARLQPNYIFKFEHVNSDYSDRKNVGNEHIDILNMKSKDYKAIAGVATYNNEQSSLPLPTKRATAKDGTKLNFNQIDLLKSLDDETRAKTILAMMNTEKDVKKRIKAGVINQLTELKDLVALLKKTELASLYELIQVKKNRIAIIVLTRDAYEPVLNDQVYSFSIDKWKPPP